MDQTPFSRTRALETATILKRFPASDADEIARLMNRPAHLAAYLAKSNDLTRNEAQDGLSLLQAALPMVSREDTLKAA